MALEDAKEFYWYAYVDYIEFIDLCRNKSYPKSLVLHNHHIIPKNMTGADEKTNFVKLSVDDHVLAHLMLAKCWPDNTKGQIDNYRSSRILDVWSVADKETLLKISESYRGENNPFFGKTHSAETIKLMSGENSSSYRLRTGVSYDALYGDSAILEKEKRSVGVKASWDTIDDEDRKRRLEKLASAAHTYCNSPDYQNPYAKIVIVDDIEYKSYKDASRFYGMSVYKMKKRYKVIEK